MAVTSAPSGQKLEYQGLPSNGACYLRQIQISIKYYSTASHKKVHRNEEIFCYFYLKIMVDQWSKK